MQITRIPFSEIPQLSKRDRSYANGAQALQDFFKYPVRVESFRQVILDKSAESTDRELLIEVVQQQQNGWPTSPAIQENIQKLADKNTFTITTAHQPCLFTGPLYCIYKVISAIKLCETLQLHYPAQQFVPIYIVGGEDHDFEEINHAKIFGKELVWETPAGGSVGKLPTESLLPVLEQLKEVLGESPNATEIFTLVEKAYTQFPTYGQATQFLFHELFKSYGVIVLDMGDAALKRAFIPMIKEEVFKQPSRALVSTEGEKLAELGFAQQATPRDINFFYLLPGQRQRIVFEDGRYHVLNTDLSFSESELVAEIDQSPEKFSPNVVMRPIYQEYILPNLAYVGGGGELAYWMERTTQFKHFGLNFPMLVRRDSVLWLDKGAVKKRHKLGLEMEELFLETEQLINTFVKKHATVELDLGTEKESVTKLFDQIAEKAQAIDPSLYKKVLAEGSKAINGISQLEGRLRKAEKQNNETAVNQIRSLKAKLFPANGLQERKDNFLEFYVKYGTNFIDTLVQQLNPLDKAFVIIED